jgi:hypothetical protein
MTRLIWVFLGVSLVLGACTQRLVCPAYQSAFIYDQDELRKKFSYFEDDSIPKVLTASKNKYLIAEPVSYRKKVRSLATVEMRQVPVHVPDSLTEDGDVSLAELDMAAQSVMDTIVASGYQAPPDSTETAEDSVYVITRDKELRLLKYDPDSIKYRVVDVRLNVDQDNYMWYLRDYLILPDVRLAKLAQSEDGEERSGKASKGERKGIKGFFANLFKRKNRQEADTTEALPPPKEEFDFVDTTAVGGAAQPQQQTTTAKKKKEGGFFSFLKKKDKGETKASTAGVAGDEPKKGKPKKEKKKKKKKDGAAPEEKKKEEEKDDGF